MNVNYFDAVLPAILVLFLLRGAMNGLLNEISGLFGLSVGFSRWCMRYASRSHLLQQVEYSCSLKKAEN
jgi:uncharacterized membrane protein required for colicin V production